MNAADAMKKSNDELGRIGRLLLSIPDAQLLMDILEEMFFNGDVVGKDANDTYFKLGQREVVKYLRDLRSTAKEN